MKARPLLLRCAAALLLAGCAAWVWGGGPADAQSEITTAPSSCIPKGSARATYLWDRLHIVPRGDGTEMPTAQSLEKLKPNRIGQIVLDPVRNVQVGFLSGVTLEAPPGTEDWTVVQTKTCPPSRWAGALAYDPVNNEIVLWGGTLSAEGPTEDVWIYDTARRDWRKVDNEAPAMRDLRRRAEALRDELETLRWDLWKTLEWEITGKQGATPGSVLARRLDELTVEVGALAQQAAAQAESTLDGYERLQVAGAAQWLNSTSAKLAALGPGIAAGTASGLEDDYRALAALRADLLSAVDSLRKAPPSRYFISLAYDPAQEALVLESADGRDYEDLWLYRVAKRRWERASPAPGSPVSPEEPQGEFVLRDAATAAELEAWRAQTSAWSDNLPPNTWVRAPAHGTGRPNWGRSWSSLVYDPDREQLYYRDGGHGSYHGNITDHYDIRTGRWFRSDVEEIPDERIMKGYFAWGRGVNYAPWAIHTYKWQLFYNPLTKRLQRPILYTPDHRTRGNLNDYDPDQGKWSKELATVKLVGRVVPGVPDGLVSVHGWERSGAIGSSIVGYQTAAGFKQWPHAGPIPFPDPNHDDGYAFIFDPVRHRVMYYGGMKDTLGLFVLDLQAEKPKWAKLPVSVADGGALPRAYREWIYVRKHDVFLTMKWYGSGAAGAPEIWSFDPKTNVFSRVHLALGPDVALGDGARNLRQVSVSAGLAYDPVSDVAFYIREAGRSPTMFAFRYVPGLN